MLQRRLPRAGAAATLQRMAAACSMGRGGMQRNAAGPAQAPPGATPKGVNPKQQHLLPTKTYTGPVQTGGGVGGLTRTTMGAGTGFLCFFSLMMITGGCWGPARGWGAGEPCS